MTEHADAALPASNAASNRASEQARLRRERREAKIKAGGADRLNKITGIGGRVVGEAEQAPTSPKAASAHADPDEIDISQHFYESKATPRRSPASGLEAGIPEAQLRQMMIDLDRPVQPNSGTGGSGTPGEGDVPNSRDDPMMRMMAQMISGAGAGAGTGNSGNPPFPGMSPITDMPGQNAALQASPYHTVWRLIHALVALGLGFYIVFFTTFSGARVEREIAAIAHQQHLAADDENEHHKRMFFWIFATSEAVLLTTRIFLDKGRAPPPGIMWTIVGFIPEPFKGYLTVGLKYGQIFSTVRSDILTCIFVLGFCAWLRT